MKPVSKHFALLALPFLIPASGAAAGEAAVAQAPEPAALTAHIPNGGAWLELRRTPALKRRSVVTGDPAPDSSLAAEAQEIGLGTTPAMEQYNELRQSVALLADGTYASVWGERVGNDRIDVSMQWIRPDGSPVFPGGGRYVANSPDNEFNPVVAPNPAGGAFVAFVRYHADTDAAQVYVQSYDAAGNPLWAPEGVFAMLPGDGDDQDDAQLVAAPDGGVYLCLDEFHSHVTDDLSDILCQRFDAAGRRLWTDQGLEAGGLHGWKVLPKLVRDKRNGVMVFWRNNRDAFTAPKDRALVEGQHLAASGTRTWGALGKIVRTSNLTASNVGSFEDLGAVSDGQGGAVLSFNDWSGRGALALDVYAQRVTGDGRLLWGSGVPVAKGNEQQQNDSLTAAPDGGAFATIWKPSAPHLLLYRLGPDGKVRWSQPLSSTDSASTPNDWGAYGSFDNGRLRIVWTHQRQDGTWTMDVYLALFDLAGHRLNGTAATPVTTAVDGQFLRGFAFDPTRKQGLAVWEDRRKGSWDDLDVIGGLYRE